jgi:hypothetical protein
MKRTIILLVLLLSNIVCNAETELTEKMMFDVITGGLLQKGYVQFDREKMFAPSVTEKFYRKKYSNEKIYTVLYTALIERGITYRLIYINENSDPERPNVISSVNIPYNDTICSFYKLNVNMETTDRVLFTIDGKEEWRNVFY